MAETSRAGRRVRWLVLLALLGGGGWIVRSRRLAAAELDDPWPAPRPVDPWPTRQDAEKPVVVAQPVALAPESEPAASEAGSIAPGPEPVVADAEPAAPQPVGAVNPLFAPVTAGDLPPITAEAPRPSPTPRSRRPARDWGSGSAAPLPDGSAPGPEYPIKGNAGSMLFHSPSSPYYERTRAEVWFRTVTDARAAGFTEWVPRKRAES